ncbi:MAG: hypothetical protein AAFX53_14920 [Bacteroidota bacterium]
MMKFITYLKFLFTSTNQYGIHSPFIYHFTTQCLYAKPRPRRNKAHAILLKSMGYFNVKTIWLQEENEDLKTQLLKKYPKIMFQKEPYDLVFLDDPGNIGLSNWTMPQEKIHNNTILMVNAIYQNAASKNQWANIKTSHAARVTIDLFHLGIVFFRREQARQHFKIRL